MKILLLVFILIVLFAMFSIIKRRELVGKGYFILSLTLYLIILVLCILAFVFLMFLGYNS